MTIRETYKGCDADVLYVKQYLIAKVMDKMLVHIERATLAMSLLSEHDDLWRDRDEAAAASAIQDLTDGRLVLAGLSKDLEDLGHHLTQEDVPEFACDWQGLVEVEYTNLGYAYWTCPSCGTDHEDPFDEIEEAADLRDSALIERDDANKGR